MYVPYIKHIIWCIVWCTFPRSIQCYSTASLCRGPTHTVHTQYGQRLLLLRYTTVGVQVYHTHVYVCTVPRYDTTESRGAMIHTRNAMYYVLHTYTYTHYVEYMYICIYDVYSTSWVRYDTPVPVRTVLYIHIYSYLVSDRVVHTLYHNRGTISTTRVEVGTGTQYIPALSYHSLSVFQLAKAVYSSESGNFG